MIAKTAHETLNILPEQLLEYFKANNWNGLAINEKERVHNEELYAKTR